MGQSWTLFVNFSTFQINIQLEIEESIDVLLGIQTEGSKMVGTNGSTELWLFEHFLASQAPRWVEVSTICNLLKTAYEQNHIGSNVQC